MEKQKNNPIIKKKVPLGKAIRFSDEDLDQLSRVTPADIEKSKQAWKRTVPKEYKTLLDAESVKDVSIGQ